MTRYQTVKADPAVVDELRRLSFDLAARAGRRVTISAALAAALAVARRDIEATAAALPDGAE